MKYTLSEFKKLLWKKGWLMCSIGAIVYAVLRIFQKPKDFYGICPYFEIKGIGGGFSLGWFFICDPLMCEENKAHEVGHCVQNATIGAFKMFFYSIGSALRYWYRIVFGAKTPYDAWWFEGDATALGNKFVALVKEGKIQRS